MYYHHEPTTREKVLRTIYAGMLLTLAYTLGRIDEREGLTAQVFQKFEAKVLETTGLDKLLK